MPKQIAFAAAVALTAALAAALPTAASATVYTLTGARQNVNTLNPLGVGRCGPGRSTVDIQPAAPGSSTGTSNLGDFTSTQSHCITPPLPASFDSGLFTYTFAGGDTIFGTYTGTVSLSGTPGVFDTIENLIVTGGTGQYLNAIGAITTTGQLQFIAGSGVYSGAVNGRFDTSAVPEPGVWGMLIVGLGLTGAMLRRRKSLTPLAG